MLLITITTIEVIWHEQQLTGSHSRLVSANVLDNTASTEALQQDLLVGISLPAQHCHPQEGTPKHQSIATGWVGGTFHCRPSSPLVRKTHQSQPAWGTGRRWQCRKTCASGFHPIPPPTENTQQYIRTAVQQYNTNNTVALYALACTHVWHIRTYVYSECVHVSYYCI